MLQNLRRRAADDQGFALYGTLLGLLIIGVLVAVGLPTYDAQHAKQVKKAVTAINQTVSSMENCPRPPGDVDCHVYGDTELTVYAGGRDYDLKVVSDSLVFTVTRRGTKLTPRCFLPKGKHSHTGCPRDWLKPVREEP